MFKYDQRPKNKMSKYSRLRELGFDRKDALLRSAAYKLCSFPIDEADVPEVVVADHLDTLERLVDPQYVSHLHKPREPTTLSQTSRSHLDTTLVAIQVSYRFHKDLFSTEMTQRYERAIKKVPESKKPLLDAINAIPRTVSPAELSEYLEQIDERYVVRQSE